MDTNRRDALKLGASAAMSSMLISNAIAAPDSQPKIGRRADDWQSGL
ncbi:hypothetical protein [Polynucleobacter necessarius]|nr:hypothetical protein [Polynucleobacter necessarius]